MFKVLAFKFKPSKPKLEKKTDFPDSLNRRYGSELYKIGYYL